MNNTATKTPVSLFGAASPSTQPLARVEANPQGTTGTLAVFKSQEDIVLFGTEPQRKLSQALDGYLEKLSKGNSPVLFELFRTLQKGIQETNIGELETTIKAAQGKKWYHRTLDKIGMSSVAKRLEDANEEVSKMLTSKSATILDLTKKMENDLGIEVGRLVQDSKMMAQLADTYRKSIVDFEEYVNNGKAILAKAKEEEALRLEASAASGDSLMIEQSKMFSQCVGLLENRLLALENVLAEAPIQLEAIRLSQGASFQTLAEVASGATGEFSTIKTTLIRLSVANNISGMQTLTDERRKLRDSLQSHSTETLGRVAVEAARKAGESRLEDSQKLLDFAQKMSTISQQVQEEGNQNKIRFEQAREKLTQAKKTINIQ